MTDTGSTGTSGGAAGTDGGAPRLSLPLAIAVFVGVGLIQCTMNVLSTLADREGTGVEPWQVWLWEFSSLAVWFALAPLIWFAVKTLRPPLVAWPVAALSLVAITIPVSAIHVAAMVAIRKAVYASVGLHYSFADTLWGGFVYEYRKDIATFTIFALLFGLGQWALSRHAGLVLEPALPAMLAVRDGSAAYQVPADEIDYLASAGNYIEVHWGDRTLLHRATLTAVEKELADTGFVRIHRSILVRRAAIRRIETSQSGDFTLELASGAQIKGSRRYRSAVQG